MTNFKTEVITPVESESCLRAVLDKLIEWKHSKQDEPGAASTDLPRPAAAASTDSPGPAAVASPGSGSLRPRKAKLMAPPRATWMVGGSGWSRRRLQ